MSDKLQTALRHYQAGAFDKALSAIGPFVTPRAKPVLQLLLVAAQCCAKTARYTEAASYYGRAAEVGGDKKAMLRALQAEMLAQADEILPALTAARKAVKTLDFDRNTLATFRNFLNQALCLDERLMEDQAFLDRLRLGDPRYCAVEQYLENLAWCADESINARMSVGVEKGLFFTQASRDERRRRAHQFADKIRIGYLSNDFSDQHPTMLLFQGVLMAHDPERFEVTLFCHTDDDLIKADSGIRARYPRLVRIGHLDDEAAADLIRAEGIDILVDLKGHTKGARISLINRGLAPIQVAYLGYPGSGNGIDCDYVIGDAIVLPDSSKPHYHEKFCLMPESYQANDDRFRPLPPPSTRQAQGLPEHRLVFGAFNGLRKISPQTAEIWAEVLRRVEHSVLWMLCRGDFARENFCRWMEREGVARERIIFAPAALYRDHIARLPVADIGLDSFPYNGHTTTSDKLWAGLPVPTYIGSHFASRVSASLLTALDVPELVAPDLEGYVELTVRLATDHAWRTDIRRRIADNRRRAPLFDTTRFARHLETAFEMMVARAKAGLEPDHITVPAMPRKAADTESN
ncbi:MAG: hypothetical protein ACK4PN_06965 [Allorhizobium sp.]